MAIDKLEDRIFLGIFRFIGYLIARIIRFTYDVIVYLVRLLIAKHKNKPKPMDLPMRERFEHMLITGGSGHGKTMLLQQCFLNDLEALKQGDISVVIIDSQGDFINKILKLADMKDLSDRLILIDPNDIDHPPALNLFDLGLERIKTYSAVEREKLINGAISLYEYIFSALLGAELTSRQGVIFRYIARLMMVVPNATIYTLAEFMKDPEKVRPFVKKLEGSTRLFFETEFFSPEFNNTRQQISTRLWGVLSNSVLERMFASEKNKVDLFNAMNRGSLILINTAKDLLKQEGCEILGRFFIALICQSAQERVSIHEEKRKPTFVYIDEAHDYFDKSLGNLLNQARKYRVGLILAHQNLDQFDTKLLATVLSSTSIKLAGGVSSKDAVTLAREMKCNPEDIQSVKKNRDMTEFFSYRRNSEKPFVLDVPLGLLESKPVLTDAELEKIKEQNRQRYCGKIELSKPVGLEEVKVTTVEKPELL